MARGWESKSIESQMEDREKGRVAPGPPLTPEARALQEQRVAHELSRARVLDQLANCQSDARRAALEKALAFLDEEISKLQR